MRRRLEDELPASVYFFPLLYPGPKMDREDKKEVSGVRVQTLGDAERYGIGGASRCNRKDFSKG